VNARSYPRYVRVCEVGPRDGLQNERTPVATEDKIRYIDLLTAAGPAVLYGCLPRLPGAPARLGSGAVAPELIRCFERIFRATPRALDRSADVGVDG
jgi:hypothetical protein